MDLGPIEITRKTGEEKFKSKSDLNKISLLEFWQWSTSDLLANTTRGYLAEFIVANDLGVNKTLRTDWKSYDLTSKKGLKIEIKTSAYIQTWEQSKISKIIYSINPSKNYDPIKNRFDGKPFRDSDYYIFCLLHHTDQKTINPLDLDQWAFYVLETRILEEKLPKQKTITLSSLLKLNPVKCKYGQINKIIEP
ncbi:hypothetical protein V8G56_16120 [Gaetbulibacter aquiaggeris]|uniref:Uncharacterized protein n=1 Tax=Gaetbulibacter aquiaggeris TaxID=1735373 RepID=A0ABW7MYM1_9FLAO